MVKGLIWATAEDLGRNRGRVLMLYRQILRSINSPDLRLNLAARLGKKAEARAIFMLHSEERSLHNIEDLIDCAEYALSMLKKGSGSSYLYGFFDQAWKEGMTQSEAEQLVVKAVSLAIARDGASGGVVRTVTINSDGVTRKFHPGDELPIWHEELEPHDSLLAILSSASPDPMVS